MTEFTIGGDDGVDTVDGEHASELVGGHDLVDSYHKRGIIPDHLADSLHDAVDAGAMGLVANRLQRALLDSYADDPAVAEIDAEEIAEELEDHD